MQRTGDGAAGCSSDDDTNQHNALTGSRSTLQPCRRITWGRSFLAMTRSIEYTDKSGRSLSLREVGTTMEIVLTQDGNNEMHCQELSILLDLRDVHALASDLQEFVNKHTGNG